MKTFFAIVSMLMLLLGVGWLVFPGTMLDW